LLEDAVAAIGAAQPSTRRARKSPRCARRSPTTSAVFYDLAVDPDTHVLVTTAPPGDRAALLAYGR
jgi:hypothetical protein